MRIACFPGPFPMLPETPVLNQITGLVDRGHEVAIFPDRRRGGAYHPDIDRLGLLARARFPEPAPGWWPARLAGALALARQQDGPGGTVLRRALNPFRFGWPALTARLAWRAAPLLPPQAFDVIQAGFGEQGRLALRLRQLGAIRGPIATAFRGVDLERYVRLRGRGVYRRLFADGELFLPVCHAFARKLEALGCPPARIRVHGTGINLRLFRFSPRSVRDPIRLLSLGRLVEKKGFADAIDAVAELVRRGVAVTYDIAGDGELEGALRSRIRDRGLDGHVRLLGARPQAEVVALLEGADLLLAPNITAANGDEEGIPNVLKEAMASGVPVITTPHSGIPELVEDGVTGLLAPERDPAGLVRAVERLRTHPDLWAPIAAAARRKVEAEYDIEVLNDRLVRVYEGMGAG